MSCNDYDISNIWKKIEFRLQNIKYHISKLENHCQNINNQVPFNYNIQNIGPHIQTSPGDPNLQYFPQMKTMMNKIGGIGNIPNHSTIGQIQNMNLRNIPMNPNGFIGKNIEFIQNANVSPIRNRNLFNQINQGNIMSPPFISVNQIPPQYITPTAQTAMTSGSTLSENSPQIQAYSTPGQNKIIIPQTNKTFEQVPDEGNKGKRQINMIVNNKNLGNLYQRNITIGSLSNQGDTPNSVENMAPLPIQSQGNNPAYFNRQMQVYSLLENRMNEQQMEHNQMRLDNYSDNHSVEYVKNINEGHVKGGNMLGKGQTINIPKNSIIINSGDNAEFLKASQSPLQGSRQWKSIPNSSFSGQQISPVKNISNNFNSNLGNSK